MSVRKTILPKTQIITSGSMTSTSTITSTAVDISYLDNIAIHAIFTGTPTGTFTVEGSIDGVTYRDLGISPAISAAGAASDHLISLNNIPFIWIHLKYVNASGTGTLNAYISGKAI